MPRKDSLTQTL